MEGRFDLARELLAEATAIFEELGQTLNSSVSHLDAIVEMLAGDPAAAEKHLLEGYRALEEMGDKAFLLDDGRVPRSGGLRPGAGRGGQPLHPDQRGARLRATTCSPRSIWRSARAGFLARQGRIEEAESARAGGGDDGRVDRLRHDPRRRSDGAGNDPSASRAAGGGKVSCGRRVSRSTSGRGTSSPPGRSGPIWPSCFKCETIRSRGEAPSLISISNELLRLGMVVAPCLPGSMIDSVFRADVVAIGPLQTQAMRSRKCVRGSTSRPTTLGSRRWQRPRCTSRDDHPHQNERPPTSTR